MDAYYIVAYGVFLIFVIIIMISLALTPTFSDRKKKKKVIREFEELVGGEIYINRNDSKDPFKNPFKNIEEYVKILDKKLNSEGVRYVQYKKMYAHSDSSYVGSMEWDTFIRIYKRTKNVELQQ